MPRLKMWKAERKDGNADIGLGICWNGELLEWGMRKERMEGGIIGMRKEKKKIDDRGQRADDRN